MAIQILRLDDQIHLKNGKILTIGQLLNKVKRLEKALKAEKERYHMSAEDALIVSRC